MASIDQEILECVWLGGGGVVLKEGFEKFCLPGQIGVKTF